MLSPAWPWSRSFRNISTPVQTVFWVSRRPTISTSSLDLHHPALHPAGDHRPAAGDGEDVLHGHEEGLVDLPLRGGEVAVHGLHELVDAGVLGGLRVRAGGLEGLQGRALHDGDLVPGEAVLGEELPDLQLHQLHELGVVHHVHLVQEDHHAGDADLAGEEDVLPGLGHGALGGRHHEDGPVHLGGAGDHVLDVVGVARAVHVGVVALVGLVLHVGDGDGDAPLPLLGGLVDLVEGDEGDLRVLEAQGLRDRRGERGLPVVDVADGPDVHVLFRPLELGFGHARVLPAGGRVHEVNWSPRPGSNW